MTPEELRQELAQAVATITNLCDATEVWPEGIADAADADMAMREALYVLAKEIRTYAQGNLDLAVRAACWLAFAGTTVTVACDLCDRKWERERRPYDHHQDERCKAEVCDQCHKTLRDGIRRARDGAA